MRITCGQLAIHDGRLDLNLQHGLDLLENAPQSDVYLLPELFTTGYAFSVWEEAADRHTPEVVRALKQLAVKRDAAVMAGTIARNEQGQLVNRLWWLSPNGDSHYDKAHLIAAFREPELLARGTELFLSPHGEAKLHGSICFDLRFPEMYRAAAIDGAEALLVISEWPAKRQEPLVTLARARAMENQAWLVLCNRAGDADDGTAFAGGSMIIDPEGVVVAEAGAEHGYCSAEIDIKRVHDLRENFPVLSMSRRAW
jgi:omega-amidase